MSEHERDGIRRNVDQFMNIATMPEPRGAAVERSALQHGLSLLSRLLCDVNRIADALEDANGIRRGSN